MYVSFPIVPRKSITMDYSGMLLLLLYRKRTDSKLHQSLAHMYSIFELHTYTHI